MQKSAFRLAVIGIITLVLAACAGVPAVVVEPAEYDFGPIPDTQLATATLSVRNEGDQDLEITGVRTSCGCTTANLSQNTVAAGESIDLEIAFDPQAHPGLYGPLLRIVYLETNDPQHPEMQIPVTVEVLEPQEAQS